MDRVCLVLPILPEKTADARVFQEELDGPRKPEYAASERSIGIDKEVWFIASAPTGDQAFSIERETGKRTGWNAS